MTECKNTTVIAVLPRLTDSAGLRFGFVSLLRDIRWEAGNRGSHQWCRCVLDYTPEGGPSLLHTPCEASQTRSESFTAHPSSHPTGITNNKLPGLKTDKHTSFCQKTSSPTVTVNWLQSRNTDAGPVLNFLLCFFFMHNRINHHCLYFLCWLLTHHSSLISQLIQTGSPVKLQYIHERIKAQRCSVWFTESPRPLWSQLPEVMFGQRLLFYCKLPAERSISGSPAKERQASQLLCIHTQFKHRLISLDAKLRCEA